MPLDTGRDEMLVLSDICCWIAPSTRREGSKPSVYARFCVGLAQLAERSCLIESHAIEWPAQASERRKAALEASLDCFGTFRLSTEGGSKPPAFAYTVCGSLAQKEERSSG